MSIFRHKVCGLLSTFGNKDISLDFDNPYFTIAGMRSCGRRLYRFLGSCESKPYLIWVEDSRGLRYWLDSNSCRLLPARTPLA